MLTFVILLLNLAVYVEDGAFKLLYSFAHLFDFLFLLCSVDHVFLPDILLNIFVFHFPWQMFFLFCLFNINCCKNFICWLDSILLDDLVFFHLLGRILFAFFWCLSLFKNIRLLFFNIGDFNWLLFHRQIFLLFFRYLNLLFFSFNDSEFFCLLSLFDGKFLGFFSLLSFFDSKFLSLFNFL